ncbi:MAG: AAA family ATPase [Pseudanabaena sp. ELA607]|jgi:predicted ATPase
MRIKVKNLGALKQAEFTLGDLTIVCGCNNTGKTYATYALFGFLYTWRQVFHITIDPNRISQLIAEGVMHLDINEYIEDAEKIINRGNQAYTKQLSKIFAAPSERFKETEFQAIPNIQDINLTGKFERRMRSTNTEIFSITKNEESAILVVTLLANKENNRIPPNILEDVIEDAIKDVVFAQLFPRAFIASTERTGATIFRKELNFARNRLLEELGQVDKDIDHMELLFKDYEDYALPIKANVDFIRQLETIVKKSSFIAESHPDILKDFASIIGGSYNVTRNNELYYVPQDKRIKLPMDESSSAVRSLLDIGFYLRHEAQQGDLLMIDEPELNLHPENQRRVVRLFARLVNIGIKVFITTHSDYIIKELNTLIMLNRNKPHLKRIADAEGYRSEELISASNIKVYIAQESLVMLDGKTKRTNIQTLVPADIHSEMGIKAESFDQTIETMNRIQDEIIWGED